MKKASLGIVLAGLLSATALPAWSAGYVGANLGQADWKTGNFNGVAGDSSGGAYKLYGGWQFTPNWALEAGYADLGKFEGTGNARARGVYLDAVGTLPLATDWSLLGRVGVINTRSRTSLAGVDSSSSGTDWKAGVGVQYNLTKTLAIRGELERYRVKAFNTKTNADMASIGLNWSF